jgi:hypothetical protein
MGYNNGRPHKELLWEIDYMPAFRAYNNEQKLQQSVMDLTKGNNHQQYQDRDSVKSVLREI